jgi:hypothetical protein
LQTYIYNMSCIGVCARSAASVFIKTHINRHFVYNVLYARAYILHLPWHSLDYMIMSAASPLLLRRIYKTKNIKPKRKTAEAKER